MERRAVDRLPPPGVGVGRCDSSERGPSGIEFVRRSAERPLDERVLVGGGPEQPQDLEGADDVAARAGSLRRVERPRRSRREAGGSRRRPVWRSSAASPPTTSTTSAPPEHTASAARPISVDLEHAELSEHCPRPRPESSRQGSPGIGVLPGATRDEHGIEFGEQIRTPGIRGGPLSGGSHQPQRVRASGAIHCRADPYQHRGSGIDERPGVHGAHATGCLTHRQNRHGPTRLRCPHGRHRDRREGSCRRAPGPANRCCPGLDELSAPPHTWPRNASAWPR